MPAYFKLGHVDSRVFVSRPGYVTERRLVSRIIAMDVERDLDCDNSSGGRNSE